MPLQNRVDPFGNLVATSAKGTLMGNRGCLHDDQRRIVSERGWETKYWITCVTDWPGRKRTLMKPKFYTELFFLDEPTALAAGHRPCAECRRTDYNRFKTAFTVANRDRMDGDGAAAIDRLLHADRLQGDSARRTWLSPITHLPDGVMFVRGGSVFLKANGRARKWAFGGYGTAVELPEGQVEVLTPLSTCRAIGAGYAAHLQANLI